MSGNVWEWTRSIYTQYPYDPKDGRENLEADSDTLRAVRGGAFDYFQSFARCACRDRYLPDYGNGYLGCRLVVVPL